MPSSQTRRALLAGALATLFSMAPAAAQVADSTRVTDLERRLDVLTREIERLTLGREVVHADTSIAGMGPAASKVYKVERGVSLGGYGEVLYEHFATEREDGGPADAPDRFDALRAIVYVGYKFNDRLLFNSEIEVEHAEEISLEFGYIDYLLGDGVGVRAGLLLAPLGLVNELHEPPAYLGTERPVTETRIIPTTWRENGVGLFGRGDAFRWRVYVMNSFDGAGFGPDGLRGGRQKGSRALANDLGVAGRVDYVGRAGLTLGASLFSGHTTQGRRGGAAGGVSIWDAHLDYRAGGWEVRALVAAAHVDDVAELNDLAGLSGGDAIGSDMLGWYLQAGYDVLRGRDTGHQLIPYVRHERVDTQRTMVAGDVANPAHDLTVTSLGVAWKPVPQVVGKVGYQIHSNRADTGVDQWNVGLGWLF